MNPILMRAMQIATQYGKPAAEAFLQRFAAPQTMQRFAPAAERFAPAAPRFTPGSLASAPSAAPAAGGMAPGTAGATIAAGTAASMRPPVDAPSERRGPNIPDEVYMNYTRAIDPSNRMPPAPEAEIQEPGFSGAQGSILEEALAKAREAAMPREAARSAPMPRPRPEVMSQSEPAERPGLFSGLFKDPYEGKSSRELYEMYQQRGDQDPAMFARASAREAAGMAHGGAAEGGKGGGQHKDAAIMKALEIIHHMLRGR